MSTVKIREVHAGDDFVKLNDLIKQTLRRTLEGENLRSRYYVKADRLRNMYLSSHENGQKGQQSEDSYGRAFVAEENDQIVTVMGVTIANDSKNGYILPGFSNASEHVLRDLLKKCEEVVKNAGGKQLCRFTTLLPGKIRNQDIAFWEKFGFIADDYFHALIKLEVGEWEPPANLNTTNIGPASDMELDIIIKILNEEGQEEIAQEFRERYPEKTLDHVFLTLRNEQNEVMAIAYYHVVKFKDKSKDGKVYGSQLSMRRKADDCVSVTSGWKMVLAATTALICRKTGIFCYGGHHGRYSPKKPEKTVVF